MNTVFYISPTKKIHASECRHCKSNNTGWQKIDSIVIAVDEGYQICRLCCPSLEEIESLRQTIIVTPDNQTDEKESLAETKSSDSATQSESSKLTAETTTVKTKKTNQQKKAKADNPIVEIEAKESDSTQNQTESLINEKINQELVTEVVELKPDENNQTDRDNQPVKETKSQQKAKKKGKTTPTDSDSQKTAENQTQESTEEIKPDSKTESETLVETEKQSPDTESETLVETEKQSPDTESTSENQTKSNKNKNKNKNKQQSPENLENQANKAEKGQKSENDTDSKSDDKSEAKTTEPKKEKKRYKILAGNGAHQAIAEVNGILVPPTEPTGKFTLVLPDGLQLEALFRGTHLIGLAFTTNLMIGQHWFRGYPKMQNDKLVAFQIIAWDGNMPTNERGWEVWEFIGVWTLQKNLTVQRTLMDEEIKQIAKETGFIKKFKYTFTNAFEWMKSKKLWVGYVYKLICRREGATLSIQKVIPFACPRKKPLPPGSNPPPGKGSRAVSK